MEDDACHAGLVCGLVGGLVGGGAQIGTQSPREVAVSLVIDAPRRMVARSLIALVLCSGGWPGSIAAAYSETVPGMPAVTNPTNLYSETGPDKLSPTVAAVPAPDTTNGEVLKRIPVGHEPHGLTVWPQPGRYSLGHTGNMR